MGIFDNFLAPFNTSSQDKASADQQAMLTAGYGQASDQFGQGRSAIATALGNSTGALNTAGGNATDAYGRSLGTGTNALTTSLANSVAPFQQNLQQGQAGQAAYGDATGANGQAGNTRAVNNFQAGPGYQFNMDQMLQNVLRAQQASGQGNSGATDNAVMQQAHGLADQGWQSYIQNLSPFLNSSNAAAQGVAGANQNAGNQISQLNQNTASGVAGSGINIAQLLTGANQNAGNQTNQNFTTQGNAAYGTAAGIGNAKASADLAPLTAGKNIMGAGMDIASLVAGLPPGMFSGGGGNGGAGYNPTGGASDGFGGNKMNFQGFSVGGA